MAHINSNIFSKVYVSHLEGKISPLVENVVWLGEWASFPWPVRTVSGWWYNHVSLVGVRGRRHPTLKLDECHTTGIEKGTGKDRPSGSALQKSLIYQPMSTHQNGFENYDDSDVEQQIGLQDLLASDLYIAHAKIKFWGSDSSHYDDSIETKALQMGQVIRNFLDKHLFLDSSFISVWGWGSGASLALKLSELGILNLKCTMAINPVMDWKLYGSYWSERLLGSIFSEGAQRRYEESNILRALDLANGTQILLMQSTKDPLSHHSFGIAQHLISRGMYFQHIILIYLFICRYILKAPLHCVRKGVT
ncbi:Venom dipeptidyl peptidase 4 [Armadillidium nasatum]|uniref:Venom dipeptidyl peptidase 4 n=1 Tax=Armadillidium nasatum TaxID=96803 RepID=A0A5N5TEG4_9CRUS|nr:Venom dipeptidyl peptidase 4 [Armadillidium nasatum]